MKDDKKSKVTVDLKKKFFAISHAIGVKMNFIYAFLLVCALVYALAGLNYILNRPDDSNYLIQKQNTSTTKFDEDTIKHLKALDSQQSTNQQIPSGRYNPFSE